MSADVATLPYPGVATDYSPLLVAMLTVSDGVGILTENLFSGRFRYVEELRRMGADIRTEGHHAVVRGVPRLSGAPVRAPDIRAGVALVAGRARGRGGDGGERRAPHPSRLRGPGGRAALARRQGDRAGEPGATARRPGSAARAGSGGRPRRAGAAAVLHRARRRHRRPAVARLAYRRRCPYTVGLTGAPGSGKSTLTDGLIAQVRAGWPEPRSEPVPQVGVLAVDPTSPFSGGAILGDRVRMSQHALDPTVFIRSMATRGHLGGLSLAVPDAVRLLGAAGIPRGHRRDRRRRADGGGDRVRGRHDGGRGHPGVG